MSPETMPQPVAPEAAPPGPEIDHNYDDYITEDDAPVDSPYSEKQQNLLARTLHANWDGPGEGRPFVAMANVGLFYRIKTPAIVPDMLLSLDVALPEDIWTKKNRSYFQWNYGKPPDLVVEIVSNTEGEETGDKFRIYAESGVPYYVVWDPELHIQNEMLATYVLNGSAYERMAEPWFPRIGLGVTVWRGQFEDYFTDWLRWCDQDGNLMPTDTESRREAVERADQLKEEARLADEAATKAKHEARLADEAATKAKNEARLADEAATKAKHEARLAAEATAKANESAAKHEARIQRLLAQLKAAGLKPENGEHKAD